MLVELIILLKILLVRMGVGWVGIEVLRDDCNPLIVIILRWYIIEDPYTSPPSTLEHDNTQNSNQQHPTNNLYKHRIHSITWAAVDTTSIITTALTIANNITVLAFFHR